MLAFICDTTITEDHRGLQGVNKVDHEISGNLSAREKDTQEVKLCFHPASAGMHGLDEVRLCAATVCDARKRAEEIGAFSPLQTWTRESIQPQSFVGA